MFDKHDKSLSVVMNFGKSIDQSCDEAQMRFDMNRTIQ